jgi:uncharacterized protein YbaP (TraB family)
MTFNTRRACRAATVSGLLIGFATAPAVAQSLAGLARPPAAQSTGSERGFFWKVERDGRHAWLVGSMHLATPDFYPLPPALEKAFADSDVLMQELDMNEANDPAVAAAILQKALNPAGTTLSAQLSRETVAVVTTFLAKRGLNLDSLQAMKPWMVSITVQALALQQLGFDPKLGIDQHFQNAAVRARKRLQPLETALEQVTFLDGLSPKTQDVMLRESVEAVESESSQIKAIAAAWRAGDAATMERIALSDMNDAPEVYETLLASRNRRWMPKVESCLQTSRCFIVVGAAHLLGRDGLITLLKARGYSVLQQ